MNKKTDINNKQNLVTPSLPSGVKDILPIEAKELKLIKKQLAKKYESFGYDEVFTPVFEYLDVLSLQSGERIKREMFKFLDERGDLLALRPDMTISIARLVSQKLSMISLPLRLFYQANVFRQQKPLQGQPREFWQSGVEIIGGDQIMADVEIIILLIDSLKNLGLQNFKVGVGSIAFVKSLLDSFPAEGAQLKKYLAQKNLVAVNRILNSTKSRAVKEFRAILELKGEKALNQAKKLSLNKETKKALFKLNKVVSLLDKLGYDEYVTYDFTLVPNFDYYTGFVFEVYVDGLGLPVASGGRYDNLFENFGCSFRAAGFAIGMERLHLALVNQGQFLAESKIKIILQGQLSADLYALAKQLRQKNISVRIFSGQVENEKKLLRDWNAKWLVSVSKGQANIMGMKEKKIISLDELKGWLENA